MNKCQFINAVTKRMCNNDGLPSEYKKLEYIESTGTQYINTGFYVSQLFSLEVKGCYDRLDVGHRLFGYYYYISGKQYSCGIRVEAGINYFLYTNPTSTTNYNWLSASTADTNIHDFYFSTKYSQYKINESVYSLNKSYWYLNDKAEVCLFADRNYGSGDKIILTYDEQAYGKIYSCKIYDTNDELVRNFIPALYKPTQKPGLYDTVTKTFFVNQGTGEFLYG